MASIFRLHKNFQSYPCCYYALHNELLSIQKPNVSLLAKGNFCIYICYNTIWTYRNIIYVEKHCITYHIPMIRNNTRRFACFLSKKIKHCIMYQTSSPSKDKNLCTWVRNIWNVQKLVYKVLSGILHSVRRVSNLGTVLVFVFVYVCVSPVHFHMYILQRMWKIFIINRGEKFVLFFMNKRLLCWKTSKRKNSMKKNRLTFFFRLFSNCNFTM